MRRQRRESYDDLLARAARSWGYVYLLRCERTGWTKIGWTLKNPGERAREVQSEFRNGFDFRLHAAFACFDPPSVERMFHNLFDTRRITDKREWFDLPPAQADAAATTFAFIARGRGDDTRAYERGRRDGAEELLRGAIAELEEAILDHALYVGYSCSEEELEGLWWSGEEPTTREGVIEEIMLDAGAVPRDRKGIECFPTNPWRYLDLLADTLDAVGEDGQGLKYEALAPPESNLLQAS
jgi:hypothetical protein